MGAMLIRVGGECPSSPGVWPSTNSSDEQTPHFTRSDVSSTPLYGALDIVSRRGQLTNLAPRDNQTASPSRQEFLAISSVQPSPAAL